MPLPKPPARKAALLAPADFEVSRTELSTQVATVVLAAKYSSLIAVILGTTLGMLIANAPAVWLGEVLAQRINMKWMRWVARWRRPPTARRIG